MSGSVMSIKQVKNSLGWWEWLEGWCTLILETFFQKLHSRHLHYPFPLPALNGLNCIVTGCTSGIGLEIAKQLTRAGANVTMAVRNVEAARDIVTSWNESGLKADNADIMELDLLSLESVVKFSRNWNSNSKPLHRLINNAGIFGIGESRKFSRNGYETHLQVNHLGPALLAFMLWPSLQKGAPSRVVNVNSMMHAIGYVDANDMNFEGSFSNLKAYSSSKLAQLMLFSEFQKRVPEDSGVNMFCVDPGSVRTNIARNLPKIVQVAYHWLPFFLFDAHEGSRSALYAATYSDVMTCCTRTRGEGSDVCVYIACNCRPVRPSREAHNVVVSRLVWEKTLDMVGLDHDVMDKLVEGKEVACRYEAI